MGEALLDPLAFRDKLKKEGMPPTLKTFESIEQRKGCEPSCPCCKMPNALLWEGSIWQGEKHLGEVHFCRDCGAVFDLFRPVPPDQLGGVFAPHSARLLPWQRVKRELPRGGYDNFFVDLLAGDRY